MNIFTCYRYCNWLHNGKPVGVQNSNTTEGGAYTLNGTNLAVKNPGAKYHIPTKNEWIKAGYYKGGGTNAGYWTYATQSDTPPTCVIADSTGSGPLCNNSNDIKISTASSDSLIQADINNTSNKLYVVGNANDRIYIIDTNTKTLIGTLSGSWQLNNIQVNKTLNKIYANSYGPNIQTIVIDGSSNTVSKTIPTAFSALGSDNIVVNEQSNKLYVGYTSGINMYIDVINCLTDTVIKTINITPGISSATFGAMHANEDDNKIYAYINNSTTGRIIVINGNSDSQESHIDSSALGNEILYFSGNLYITQYMSNKLQIIKLSDGSSSNITLNYPFFMDIDKQRNILSLQNLDDIGAASRATALQHELV
jgi:hypothetical protein